MENIFNEEDVKIVIKNYLKSVEEVSVQEWKIFPIKFDNPGFLGDYFKLRIHFQQRQGDQEIKEFFVKTLPIQNKEKREAIEHVGFFQKESFFYQNLVPKLKKYSNYRKWAPDCFFVRQDVIVLENLELFGYSTLPIRFECSENHILVALRTLAVFHASSIAYEKLELMPQENKTIGEKYKDQLYETGYFPDGPWYECSLKAVKMIALEKTKYGTGSEFEDLIHNQFEEKASRVFDILDDQITSKIQNVWCHRDTWKNNLMFRKDDMDHCLLIDFQIGRYLPPSVDVLFTIISCTRVKQHEEPTMTRYLNFYYNQLEQELLNHQLKLSEIFTFEQFTSNCQEIKLYPLLNNIFFATLSHLPENVMDNLCKSSPETFQSIMVEDRNDLVSKFMDQDEFYRDILIESVEELLQNLFDDIIKID